MFNIFKNHSILFEAAKLLKRIIFGIQTKRFNMELPGNFLILILQLYDLSCHLALRSFIIMLRIQTNSLIYLQLINANSIVFHIPYILGAWHEIWNDWLEIHFGVWGSNVEFWKAIAGSLAI